MNNQIVLLNYMLDETVTWKLQEPKIGLQLIGNEGTSNPLQSLLA